MSADIRGMAPLLQVFDMPAAIAFYRDMLGFDIVSTSQPGDDFDWALLSRNGIELMLNTAYERHARPARPDPARVASHADTALYFGCPDVEELYAELRSRKVSIPAPPAMTSYGFMSLSLRDPDGYTLCFHWPATEATRSEWAARYGTGAAS